MIGLSILYNFTGTMFWMSESTTFSHTEQPYGLESVISPMKVVMPRTQADNAQSGYSEELLYNQTILAIHLYDLERSTLETWVSHNYNLRMGWTDLSSPVFMLITFADHIDTVAPYARDKAREMNAVRPELPSVVAVVVPNSVIGRTLKVMVRSLSQTWQATSLHVFFDADEALTWLKQQVDYLSPRSASV